MLKSQKKLYQPPARRFGIRFSIHSFQSSDTINFCHLIGKYLESYLLSKHCQNLETQAHFNKWQDFGSHLTVSNLFTNISDISNIIFLPSKTSVTSYLLWHQYYYYLGMKDLIPATCYLCKDIWNIAIWIVLTGKKRLEPDIWTKTPQQVENMENMMRIT